MAMGAIGEKGMGLAWISKSAPPGGSVR